MIFALGLITTSRWALGSAQRPAALFDGGEEGVAELAVPGLGNIRTAVRPDSR